MAKKRFSGGKKYKVLPKCKFYVMSKRSNGGINVKCANKLNLANCMADNMDLSRDKQTYPRRSPIYVTPFRPVVGKYVNIYDDYDSSYRYCKKKDLINYSVGTSLAWIKRSHKWGNKYKITRKNNKTSFSVMSKSQ